MTRKSTFFIVLGLIAIYLLFFHQYTYRTGVKLFGNPWIEEARFETKKHRGIFYCQEPHLFENVQVSHVIDYSDQHISWKELFEEKLKRQTVNIIFQCEVSLINK